MYHEIRWTLDKIAQRLDLVRSLVYRRKLTLPPFRLLELPDPQAPPPVGPGVDTSDWPVIQPYTYWGRGYLDFVLSSEFRVPGDWDPEDPVALYLPLGEAGDFSHPEALVYVDGKPYAACDRHHQEIPLPDSWRDDRPRRLDLHGWTGLLGFRRNRPHEQLFMEPCFVVQIDRHTRDFLALARVALGVARHLAPDHPVRAHLLNALDDAFRQLDLREPCGEPFYASVLQAHLTLERGLQEAGPPADVTVTAVGHAHIDVAWLWTLGQTRRKASRTFHTVLRLMERFPEYRFTQSQPQLYDYVRQDHPELFQAIQARVAEGRWEPIGGMWVEADCNITGPESLARQFLLGRTFFREHFGPDAESPVLWLPDVFGYAWNLPQLIREAGLKYFFTIKIGWNQYNRLPYDTFWWQGLDGTRVLTHFSTTPEPSSRHASTYNAQATPEQILGTWENFQQKELHRELLMAYGHGDGGGGPTQEMLENIRKMAHFPGAPQVRTGRAGDFFRRLEQEVDERRLPVWNGELYLEIHRGTYTTQSRNKRANRKSEFRLHDAEFLATLAAQMDPEYTYPTQELRRAWELVCLNQFHDIIPGSSIGPVYEESLQQYQEIAQIADRVQQRALEVIAAQTGGHLLLVNPTGFPRSDLAFWPGRLAPGQSLRTLDGHRLLHQEGPDGTWLEPPTLAPYSVTPLIRVDEPPPSVRNSLQVSPERLENDFLRVELDPAGDIVRIYDKANEREVLPPGAVANQFQAFEDRPLNWDAWDIDIFYDDKVYLAEPATSIAVVESGPLRATLEIRRQILHSPYVQRISLAHNSPRLDFDTRIHWREKHILLKVAFPVDVLAPTATYEIQWGNVERPTHRNTSWDWARFETCAQKWVDLSEGGYGVSLLNDCKYGHDVRDNVMRISLLRAPTLPDPHADEGEHRFAYSLLPHPGRWGPETVRQAYALNDPLIVHRIDGPPRPAPGTDGPWRGLVVSDPDHVAVETIKRAEDGDGFIVRLYDFQRRRGIVTLHLPFPVAGAWRTNLLEENQEPLEVAEDRVRVPIRPYQVVTLRIRPR